jgi:hypothetical protein
VFADFLPQKMLQPFITPHTVLDLSSSEYFLFLKLKLKLKGLHLVDVVEIKEAITITDELKKFQKEEFLSAIHYLYNCAKASGAYFEQIKLCVFDF